MRPHRFTGMMIAAFCAAFIPLTAPGQAQDQNLTALIDAQNEARSRNDTADAIILTQNILDRLEGAYPDDLLQQASWKTYLASLYEGEGLYREALPLRESVAELRREIARARGDNPEDDRLVVNADDALGRLYEFLGRFAESERLLKSVVVRRAVDDPELWRSQQNLGAVYASIGLYDEAARSFAQAMDTIAAQEIEITTIERIILLTSLGGADARRGEYDAAQSMLISAHQVALSELGPKNRYSAFTANWLATLYKWSGDNGKSESYYKSAGESFQESLGRLHQETYINRNDYIDLLLKTWNFETAAPLLLENIAIADEAVGANHPEKALTYSYYASFLARQTGGLEVAIPFQKQAVNLLQETRNDLGAATISNQAFLDRYKDIYEQLQIWLIETGRFAEAEKVGRMMKEQEFGDYIRQNERSGNADDLMRSELTERAVDWQTQLINWADRPNRIALELATLEQRARTGTGLTPSEKAQLVSLQTQYDAAYSDYKDSLDSWMDSIRDISNEVIQAEAEAIEARFHDALQDEIADIGSDVAALQIVALQDGIHSFLITPNAFSHFQNSTPRTELNQLIFRARDQLSTYPDARPSRGFEAVSEEEGVDDTLREDLQVLYTLFFPPNLVQELKDAGIETLMLNLQGSIRYLPFAALHDGDAYLAERYKLALFTPAARTRFRASEGDRHAISFGTTQGHGGFAALPGVKAEIDRIMVGIDGKGALEGPALVDAHFTRAALERELGEGRPIVHMATHFLMRPGNDKASFLLLGDGDQLTLEEINNSSRLRFRNVDLLTLSACSTGLGSGGTGESRLADLGTGAEVEGLGVLAQSKGADAVLASLWNVSDDATSDLMAKFYETYVGFSVSKAEALRVAQRSLLAEPDTADPYFWAPFILMGNWM